MKTRLREWILVFNFIKQDLVQFKKEIFGGLLCILFGSLITFAFPYLTIQIIDFVIPRKNFALLIQILFFISILYCIKEWLFYIYQVIFFKIREKIGYRLQEEIFSNFNTIRYEDFERLKQNDKFAFVTKDINNIKRVFDQSFFNAIKDFFVAILGFSLMFTLNFYLTILIFVTVSFSGGVNYLFSKKIRKKEENVAKLYGSALNTIMMPIYKMFFVKLFNIFQLFKNKLIKLNVKLYAESLDLFIFQNRIRNLQFLLTGWLNLVILLWMGKGIMAGHYTLGELVGYQFYFNLTSSAYLQLFGVHLNLQGAIASIKRLKTFLEQKSSMDSKKIPVPPIVSSVVFKEVHFSYPEKKTNFSLKNINFTLKSNTILAIIGENGSGKTTIVKLLAGLYKPSAGQILVDHYPLEFYEMRQWCSAIGIIPQEPFVFEGTLLENIILTEPYDPQKLKSVLALSGLEVFASQLQNDIHTMMYNEKLFLSGGYLQRVSIARCLYRDIKILIVDEGSTNLDTESYNNLKQILLSIKEQNIPILLITHRESMLDIADRVVVLENGQIKRYVSYKDSPENLFAH